VLSASASHLVEFHSLTTPGEKERIVRTSENLARCPVLLNLGDNLISDKAGIIANPLLRKVVILVPLLFGGASLGRL